MVIFNSYVKLPEGMAMAISYNGFFLWDYRFNKWS